MSKLGKYLIGIVIAAVVVFIVWRFSSIVAYILISAVLSIIGRPLADAIRRIRLKGLQLPKWFAALVTMVCMWGVLITFFTLFIPLVFGKLSELTRLDIPYIVESFREPIQSFQDWIVYTFSVSDADFSLTDQISAFLTQRFDPAKLMTIVSSTISTVTHMGVAVFSITFITFFFIKEDRLFTHMIVSMFPKKFENNIIHAIDSATKLLIRYFTGIIAESTIMFILLSCAFMLWGFDAPTAFFMGFTVGILNVIPYVGPLISGTVCVIVGVLSPLPGYSISGMVMIVLSMILLIQGLDNFVLQPYLYSKRVKAHPLEIFLVILIAGSLAGIIGMLLAIPSYTVLRVFAKEFLYNFRIVQELTSKMD